MRSRIAILVVAVAVLVGCSSSAEETTRMSLPPSSTAELVLGPPELSQYQQILERLPIPLVSDDERLTIIRAKAILIEDCVHELGFTGFRVAVPRTLGPNQFNDSVRQLGILTRAPGQDGYGYLEEVRQAEQNSPTNDPGNEYLDGLTDSESALLGDALYGTTFEEIDTGTGTITVPTSGCQAEAESAIFGTDQWAALDSIRQTLIPDVFARLGADQELALVADRWRRCMAETGREFATPGALRGELLRRYTTTDDTARESIVEEEALLAERDFECQQAAGYTGEATDALVKAMTATVISRQAVLDELRKIETAGIERAAEIVAGAG